MIKVIGAGFGRTGTTSLKLALERLGFGPCYHFTEMLRARHAAEWLRIADGVAPDWNRLLADFSATTDWPAAAWYRELAAEFPDARVILTVRDPIAWHTSVCLTILPLRRALARWMPGAGRIAELTDKIVWEGTFDGRAEDRTHAVAVYERHCNEVRRTIAADRLLEFDVREGWRPLCEFLGVPVPEDTPFPRANDTARMRRALFALRALKIIIPFAIAVALILLVVRWL